MIIMIEYTLLEGTSHLFSKIKAMKSFNFLIITLLLNVAVKLGTSRYLLVKIENENNQGEY